MLTSNVLEYFLTGLDESINGEKTPVINILYSLIALEKFAQTGEWSCVHLVFALRLVTHPNISKVPVLFSRSRAAFFARFYCLVSF